MGWRLAALLVLLPLALGEKAPPAEKMPLFDPSKSVGIPSPSKTIFPQPSRSCPTAPGASNPWAGQ